MLMQSDADYHIRVDDSALALPCADWNQLLSESCHPSPFMRLEYLQALERSGSAVADTGWQAQFVSLWRHGELRAACPAYIKSHSYGEYVFDWAWAEAYGRHGLHYYPKLLVAVPFTPVPGTRLLARHSRDRRLLIQALRHLTERLRLSSAHVLFPSEEDRSALQGEGWLVRSGVQFHWTQEDGTPRSFADYLASLQREKRKKIQQEQRRVREAGVSFVVKRGHEIQATDWDFFYRCYTQTYAEHRSTPYLRRSFFADMQTHMPESWLMFLAMREGQAIAMSLLALDDAQRTAFGRYWGSVAHVPCLHFDACYYQPLSWCLQNGWLKFEGGAQGEHKLARGLLPTPTHSAHWLAHPQFRDAVADFLAHEGAAIEGYMDELREHQPFKAST